jgi:hypothetical protein
MLRPFIYLLLLVFVSCNRDPIRGQNALDAIALQKISGDQYVLVAQVAPEPIEVQVAGLGSDASDVAIRFEILPGSAPGTISSTSAITDKAGRAKIYARAGISNGTIRVRASAPQSNNPSISVIFELIIQGNATSWKIVPTGSFVAGSPLDLTISGQNLDGSVDTEINGPRFLTFSTTSTNSPDGVAPSLPANGVYNFVNGVVTPSPQATFFNSADDASETFTISVSGGGLNGITTPLSVADGPQGGVSIYSTDSCSGSPVLNRSATPYQGLVMYAYKVDSYGNCIGPSTGNWTKSFTDGEALFTSSPNNTHDVQLTPNQPGVNGTVTFTEGSYSDSTGTITATAATAHHFAIRGLDADGNFTTTAGEIKSLIIRVEDVQNDITYSYDGPHYLKWSTTATGNPANPQLGLAAQTPVIPADGLYDVVNGIITIPAVNVKFVNSNETPTITVYEGDTCAGNICGISSPITVNDNVTAYAQIRTAANNGGSVFDGSLVTTTADTTHQLYCATYDAWGNYRSDDSGADWGVSGVIAPSDMAPSLTNQPSVAFTGRLVGTGSIYCDVDPINDGLGITDNTGTITIVPGAPYRYALDAGTGEGGAFSVPAGDAFNVTVRVYDAKNNLCTNFSAANRPVTVSYNGSTAVFPAPPAEIPLLLSSPKINNTSGSSTSYGLNISSGLATIPNNILINDTENADEPTLRIVDSGSINMGSTGAITVTQNTLVNFSIMSAINGGGVALNSPNLSTDGILPMFAAGFDDFGNFVGNQIVNWSLVAPTGDCTASEIIGNPDPLTATISAKFDPVTAGLCTITAVHEGLNKTDTTGAINVSFGTATKLGVTLQSGATTVTAGTPFTIIVRALDAGNNVVTSYAPDFAFTLTTTAPNALSGEAPVGFTLTPGDFVNGVATISGAIVYRAGTSFTITASESGAGTKTGISPSISVVPGTLHHYATTSPSGPFVADGTTTFSVVVEARDQWDNLTTTGIGSVFNLSTVRLSDEPLVTTVGGGANISFGGSSTKTVSGLTYLVSHGVQIVASDSSGKSTPVALRASATFQPSQSTIKSYTITDFSTNTPTAGVAFSAKINAKDIAGNTITGVDAFLGTLLFTGSGSASNPPYANANPSYPVGFFAFTNGVSGPASFTLYTKETISKTTFMVTDANALVGYGESGSLVVDGATLNHYSNTAAVTSVNADGVTTFSATINARDTYGNIVAGNVSIGLTPFQLDASNAGTLGGTTSGLNLTSGTATVSNLTYNVAGLMELRTTGGTVSMSSARSVDYTMVPVMGTLHHYDLSFTGPATAGSSFAITVLAKDSAGNTIPNIQTGLSARQFRWTAGLNNSPEGDLTTPNQGSNFSLTFNASGTATTNVTFVRAQTLALGGLSIADNAATNIVGSSASSLLINPNVAHHFVFLGTTTGTADKTTNYSLTIESRDDWGNLTKTNNAADASLSLVPVRVSGAANVGTFTGSVTGINMKDNATVTIANVKYGVAHTTKFAFSGSPSLLADDSLSAQVAWAVSNKTVAGYTIEPSVSTTVAGVSVNYLLTALDQGGNVITNGDAALGTNTINFTTSADCNAPVDPGLNFVASNFDPANGTKTFSSGVATLSYKLFNTAATCGNAGDISITDATNAVSASNLTGITVTPATLASYATLNATGPFVADGSTGFSVDIQARDAYGNATTVGIGSPITLTANRLADEALTTSIGNGTGVSLSGLATRTITGLTYLVSHQIEFVATDANSITSGAGYRASATFSAANATLKAYEINNFSTGTPTAGVAFAANIFAKDIAGNTITGLDAILGLKVFSTGSGASNSVYGNTPLHPSGSYTFTSGVSSNISYTFYRAETIARSTFTVTDTGSITGTGTTGSIVVGGATLNHYSNTAAVTSVNADGVTTFSATINARDTYGNIVAGNTSIGLTPFQLDANNPGLLGGTTSGLNLTSGTATVSNLTYNVFGQMELRTTGGTVSMSSARSVDYTMVPVIGTLNSYALSFTGPATAGSSFAITVLAKDYGGNTIPSIESALNLRQFRWTAGLNNSPEGDLTTPNQGSNFSLTFNASGTATANVTFVKAETLAIGALTFADNAVPNKTGASTVALTINPNVAHHIVMSGASTGVADNLTTYTLTVQSRDDWGNPVKTNNVTDSALTVVPTRVSGYTNVGPLGGTVVVDLRNNATVTLNTLRYQVAHTTKFAFSVAGSIPLDDALSTHTVAWSMAKQTVASYTIEPNVTTGTAGVDHTYSLRAFDGGNNLINGHDSVLNTISLTFTTSADCNAPAPADHPTTYLASSYDPANGTKTFTTGVASLTYKLFNANAICSNAGDISVTDENTRTGANTTAVTISPNTSNYIATTNVTGFPATGDGTAQTATRVTAQLRDFYGNARTDAAITAATVSFVKVSGYGTNNGTLTACSPVSGDACGAARQNVSAFTLNFSSSSDQAINDLGYNVANVIGITVTSGAVTTPAAYRLNLQFNPGYGTIANFNFLRPSATGVAGAAHAWSISAVDAAANTMSGTAVKTLLDTIRFTVSDMSGTSQMNGPESGTVSFTNNALLVFNSSTGVATTNLTFFNATNNVAQNWLRLTNDRTAHIIFNNASNTMDITPATGHHFHVSTAGFTGTEVADGAAKTATSATITLQDQYGNLTTGLSAVTLAPIYLSGYGTNVGTMMAATVDGGARSNITSLSLNFSATSSVTIFDLSYNIFQTVEIRATQGGVTTAAADSQDIAWQFHQSTVSYYRIFRTTASGVAGSATTWQVRAFDAADNLMTGALNKADLDTRTLTFADISSNAMNGPESGTASVPTPSTYVWNSATGSANFTVTAYNRANGIAVNYLRVTDNDGKTGQNTTDSMTISGAAGNHFHVTAAGFPIVSNGAIHPSSSLTITLQDVYGNTTTDATMTNVALSLNRISGYTNLGNFLVRTTDGTGIPVSITTLTPSFNSASSVTYHDASYDVGQTFEVRATKGAVATAAADTVDLTGTISAGTVKNYTLAFNSGTVQAGNSLSATLTAFDGGGNIINADDATLNTISFTHAVLNSTFNAPNGTQTVAGNLPANGTKTWSSGTTQVPFKFFQTGTVPTSFVSVTDTTNTLTRSNNNTASVTPAPGASISIPNPLDGIENTNVNVTYNILDTYGNLDTNFQNDITLALTGSATGAGLIDIVNGTATAPVSDSVREQVFLTATYPGLTNGTEDIFFSGALSALVYITQPVANETTGKTFATQALVEGRDSTGNRVYADSSSVITLTPFTDSGCTTASGGAFVNNTATMNRGRATFSSMNFNSSGVIYSRAATAGMTTCSNAITVYPTLAITNLTGGTIAGGTVYPGNVQAYAIAGGVPPLSVAASTINSAGSLSSLFTGGTCPANHTCVNYTSGSTVGVVDTLSVSDSANVVNTVTDQTTVNGAILANTGASPSMGSTYTDISRTYTIRNNGNIASGALTITFSPDDASYWTKTSDACNGVSLAVSATCNIVVTFKGATGNSGNPTNGARSATLSAVGATNGSLTLNLTATQDGAILNTISGSGSFGSVSTNTTNTITIRNDGNANSGIIAYTLLTGTASDWIFAGTCSDADLAPGATCTVLVTFKGTTLANGSYAGTLRVKGASSEEEVLSLSATRVGAILALTAGTPAFGSLATNTTRTYTYKNNGTGNSGVITTTFTPVNANAWNLPGVNNLCNGANLAPGDTCTVDVTFTPQNPSCPTGSHSATLQLQGATTGSISTTFTGTKP